VAHVGEKLAFSLGRGVGAGAGDFEGAVGFEEGGLGFFALGDVEDDGGEVEVGEVVGVDEEVAIEGGEVVFDGGGLAGEGDSAEGCDVDGDGISAEDFDDGAADQVGRVHAGLGLEGGVDGYDAVVGGAAMLVEDELVDGDAGDGVVEEVAVALLAFAKGGFGGEAGGDVGLAAAVAEEIAFGVEDGEGVGGNPDHAAIAGDHGVGEVFELFTTGEGLHDLLFERFAGFGGVKVVEEFFADKIGGSVAEDFGEEGACVGIETVGVDLGDERPAFGGQQVVAGVGDFEFVFVGSQAGFGAVNEVEQDESEARDRCAEEVAREPVEHEGRQGEGGKVAQNEEFADGVLRGVKKRNDGDIPAFGVGCGEIALGGKGRA
jgi:hypothetical protein